MIDDPLAGTTAGLIQQNLRLRAALTRIAAVWDGSHDPRAMAQALDQIDALCQTSLQGPKEHNNTPPLETPLPERILLIQTVDAIPCEVDGEMMEMEGYQVRTTEHVYQVLISNERECCEYSGYFATEDPLIDFVGAVLDHIAVTDVGRETLVLTDALKTLQDKDLDIDPNQIQFVTFYTNHGIFQLAVYNYHNGYYGHDVLVRRDDTVLLKAIL